MIRVVCCALLLVGVARPVVAQSSWVLGGGLEFLEYRVDAGFGPERFNGPGLELSLARNFGTHVSLRVSGAGAGLQASAAGDLDRQLGQADVDARYLISSVWGFYGGLTARAISNDAGRQHWVFGRVGAEVRPAFTAQRFHALGRLGVLPFVSVQGLSSASITFEGSAGLEYEHSRLRLALLYGVERFSFTSEGAADREEQLSTLMLRGGIRL